MRASEFLTEQQLDEILPALGAMARAGAQAATKVGQKAVQKTAQTVKTTAQKVAQKGAQQVAQQLLKKGSKLPMPTANGQAKDFQVLDFDKSKKQVRLKNPMKKTPDEPDELIYNLDDIQPVIDQLTKS